MLTFSFIIAILIEIVFPFVLAFYLVRKLKTSWGLIGIGALTFVASQVVHLPLVGVWNALLPGFFGGLSTTGAQILNAIVLGLLAGLCEEPARWIGYRLLNRKGKAESFGSAITLGAGHGGIESILFAGLPVLSTLIVMNLVRSGIPIEGITAEMTAEYFAMPWGMPFVGAVERLMAIVLHITLSVAVWMSISNKKPFWFWGAVGYHALIDAIVVALASFTSKAWLIESVMAVFTALNIYFLYRVSRGDLSPVEGEIAAPEISSIRE